MGGQQAVCAMMCRTTWSTLQGLVPVQSFCGSTKVQLSIENTTVQYALIYMYEQYI